MSTIILIYISSKLVAPVRHLSVSSFMVRVPLADSGYYTALADEVTNVLVISIPTIAIYVNLLYCLAIYRLLCNNLLYLHRAQHH